MKTRISFNNQYSVKRHEPHQAYLKCSTSAAQEWSSGSCRNWSETHILPFYHNQVDEMRRIGVLGQSLARQHATSFYVIPTFYTRIVPLVSMQ